MNYYPQNYNPYYQNQQVQQTIQSGNLVSVRDENEARMYPIAPGNSVTFKDENQPYIYTKTMGFSQLDRPVFERYKLIKEKTVENVQPIEKYALKSDLADLVSKLVDLQEEILVLKGDNRKRTEGTGNAEC